MITVATNRKYWQQREEQFDEKIRAFQLRRGDAVTVVRGPDWMLSQVFYILAIELFEVKVEHRGVKIRPYLVLGYRKFRKLHPCENRATLYGLRDALTGDMDGVQVIPFNLKQHLDQPKPKRSKPNGKSRKVRKGRSA